MRYTLHQVARPIKILLRGGFAEEHESNTSKHEQGTAA
jgi:hypothetical protein